MRTYLHRFALLSAAAALLGGCDAEAEDGYTPPPEVKRDRSNITKIETSVPYGKKVACADLIPDPAPFSEAIGDEIGSVKDGSATNSKATAVCSLIRAGEPPVQDMKVESLKERAAVHGVLPGDEYCTVTAYCSLAVSADSLKESCEKRGHRMTVLDGQPACVRESQRAAKYAYTYQVIDPDTQCKLEVMGGPSVTDEPLVQGCTTAAMSSIGKSNVVKFE